QADTDSQSQTRRQCRAGLSRTGERKSLLGNLVGFRLRRDAGCRDLDLDGGGGRFLSRECRHGCGERKRDRERAQTQSSLHRVPPRPRATCRVPACQMTTDCLGADPVFVGPRQAVRSDGTSISSTGTSVGLTRSSTTWRSMMTRPMSVREGTSYIVDSRTSSRIARSPLAPVPRLMACSEMASSESGVNTNSTPSISNIRAY